MTVHVLQSLQQLVCKEEDSLERERVFAECQQILQGGSQELHDEDDILALFPEPENLRQTRGRGEVFVPTILAS